MNKKNLISTLVILAMAGCASYTKPIDKDVLKQNKISYTLDIYNTYEGKRLNNISSIKREKAGNAQEITQFIVFGFCTMGLAWLVLPIIERKYDYTTLMEQQALKCHYLEDNSDECIIYRRNHSQKDSEIGFFDYKRFLPKDSNIKNDDDFLRLFKKYKEYEYEIEKCFEVVNSNQLTSSEREEKYNECSNLRNIIDNKLNYYIHNGILEEKDNEKKKQEEEKKEIEEVKKFIDTYTEDCKQALKKGENYKKSIDYDNLYNLNNLNGNEVVDFASDGIFVQYCSKSSYYFSTCIEHKRIFIYTKDKNYADGDKFHTDVYYKRDGFYKYTTTMGGTNSVYAYKPTKHKIDKCKLYGYSHLKNKEVKCNDLNSIRRDKSNRYKLDNLIEYFCKNDEGKILLYKFTEDGGSIGTYTNCR